MRSRLARWLNAEPLPRGLHAQVMDDPRLGATGGGFRTRLAVATAALVLLLVGGGIGSVLLRGGPAQRTIAGVAASPRPSDARGLSPSPGGVTAAPPGSPAPVSACRTADLDITIGHSEGAAGTIYVPINVTARGASCSLSGYFGLALVDGAGRQVSPDPARDPSSTPATGPVLVGAGRVAVFTFHWSDVQTSPQSCATAVQLELTAPAQYDHVFVAARTADGRAIAPCSPGGSALTTVQAAG